MRDPNNNIIFANDALTSVGLARPYLHYHMAPTFNAMIEGTVFVASTRSAAYVDLYEGNHHVGDRHCSRAKRELCAAGTEHRSRFHACPHPQILW